MPVTSPDFKPGFRLSLIDVGVLILGGVAAYFASEIDAGFSFGIAFTVVHFFLFCNVFRIARTLEFIWAGAFVCLGVGTVLVRIPGWTITTVVSLIVTITVIVVEMRKPSYHGAGWSTINPNLLQWWERQKQ